MRYAAEIGGGLALVLDGLDPGELERGRSELDPLEPRAGAEEGAELVLTLRREPGEGAGPLTELQRDAGDRVLTATDGERIHLVENGRRCALPDLESAAPAIEFEPGFPAAGLHRTLVRPALQVLLPRVSAVAIHSATVEVDGGAVVVAGWSESGKTETALALMERGARFLSDKWTVVTADGTASVFPIGVGVRGWVLRHLPTMRAGLPVSARGQLLAARAAAGLTGPFVRRSGGGRVTGLARDAASRAVALGDRAGLSPSEIRAAYGDPDGAWSAPLRAVVSLATRPDGAPVDAAEADAAVTATRLARSAAFERRGLFDLYDRGRFALPGAAAPDRREHEARERNLIAPLLGSVPVFEVGAPFPTDPGPVAERILSLLS